MEVYINGVLFPDALSIRIIQTLDTEYESGLTIKEAYTDFQDDFVEMTLFDKGYPSDTSRYHIADIYSEFGIR